MRYPGRRREAAELVGRRVIVRHRLHNHQFSATDVLGTLQAWTPDGARVRRDRGGDVVHITPDDIIVIKEIPERTVTRRDVRDLEAAAAGGWVALEAEWLGGWLLRASGGFTGRGNSCLPLDDPGMPVGQAGTHSGACPRCSRYRSRSARSSVHSSTPAAGRRRSTAPPS